MVSLVVVADMQELASRIEALLHPDLTPLAESVREAMIEDNRDGLLAGTDAAGAAFVPVAESTIKRGRGGEGPPLVPRDASSRMIAAYDVRIRATIDSILLVGSWPGLDWVRYHSSGAARSHLPRRDAVGIRPGGRQRMADIAADFARDLISRL